MDHIEYDKISYLIEQDTKAKIEAEIKADENCAEKCRLEGEHDCIDLWWENSRSL